MSTTVTRNWSDLIGDQQNSGLSQKRFCEREQIPLATFGYWKRKLAGSAVVVKQESPEFVRLELPSEVTERGRAQGGQLTVELPNGVVLRFSGFGR